jgi:hypothetical protein
LIIKLYDLVHDKGERAQSEAKDGEIMAFEGFRWE